MNDIRIDVGVCTLLNINLSDIDFTGAEKIIFTVKNTPKVDAPVIIEREFTEPRIYSIKITPEESLRLKGGAEYDFNKVLADGTRIKITDNGKIIFRKCVGDCIE